MAKIFGLMLRPCLLAFGRSVRTTSSSSSSPLLSHLISSTSEIHQSNSLRTFHLYLGVNSFAPPLKERCEDAYFAFETEQSVVIGVADGVSSWKREGIDPSLFSNALMANCLKIAQNTQGLLCPSKLLEKSFQEIQHNREVPGGSSTACLLVFDKISGFTKTSNLGDSGFRVFRAKELINASQEQYHHDAAPYYAPYQLAIMPSEEEKYKRYFTNSPGDADTRSLYLQNGDIVIMGTDGLFDNLWNEEIIDFLPKNIYQMSDLDLNQLAENLAWEAQERAQDVSSDRITPYCSKLYGDSDMLVSACGGNVDDVTVVIAVIRS